MLFWFHRNAIKVMHAPDTARVCLQTLLAKSTIETFSSFACLLGPFVVDKKNVSPSKWAELHSQSQCKRWLCNANMHSSINMEIIFDCLREGIRIEYSSLTTHSDTIIHTNAVETDAHKHSHSRSHIAQHYKQQPWMKDINTRHTECHFIVSSHYMLWIFNQNACARPSHARM